MKKKEGARKAKEKKKRKIQKKDSIKNGQYRH